jgi:transcriptional regulator with XRE-family HTH domain
MEDAGVSQRALARATGVSKQSVTNWLGQAHEPRLSQIKKTADALGVSVAYLVGEDQAPGRAPSPTDDLIERFGELHASPAMRALAPRALDLFDLLAEAERLSRRRRQRNGP